MKLFPQGTHLNELISFSNPATFNVMSYPKINGPNLMYSTSSILSRCGRSFILLLDLTRNACFKSATAPICGPWLTLYNNLNMQLWKVNILIPHPGLEWKRQQFELKAKPLSIHRPKHPAEHESIDTNTQKTRLWSLSLPEKGLFCSGHKLNTPREKLTDTPIRGRRVTTPRPFHDASASQSSRGSTMVFQSINAWLIIG